MSDGITHARPGDEAAAAALEAACFPAAEAADLERIRERMAAYPQHFWLLWEGNRLISMVNGMVTDQPDLTDDLFASASRHQETGVWQMIFSVATLPEYRRRGCAARLLRQTIAESREQGRKGLVLTCKEEKLAYYSQFGFQNEGKSVSEHGGAVWYQMRLRFDDGPGA